MKAQNKWHKIKIIAVNTAIWLAIGAYLVVSLSFTDTISKRSVCKSFFVNINDLQETRFITPEEITSLLKINNIKIIGRNMDSINSDILEKILTQHPLVKRAEVFKTSDNKVNAIIYQRRPIIRIVEQTGKNYYLDDEGYVLPASSKYSSYVLIVNGIINTDINLINQINIFKSKELNKEQAALLKDIFKLAKFINETPFWNSQIVQIYLNEQGDFELITRIGEQIIIFGHADNIKKKFENLKTLYTEGFKYTGWNKYSIINLKFKNQIVCTKR